MPTSRGVFLDHIKQFQKWIKSEMCRNKLGNKLYMSKNHNLFNLKKFRERKKENWNKNETT